MQVSTFLIAVLCRCVVGKDQMGRDFVLSFIPSTSTSGSVFLFISAKNTMTLVEVNIPSLDYYTSKLLSGKTWTLQLYEHVRYKSYFEVKPIAVRIHSNQDVSVYAADISTDTSSSYMAIPFHGLGRFYVGVTYGGQVYVGRKTYYPVLLVIAFRKNTIVTISYVIANNGSCGTHATGETSDHVLNDYDVYGIICTGDFTGTQIRSSQDIAVIGGHESATMNDANGVGSDAIQEMLLPVKYYGLEFVLFSHTERPSGSISRIVTASDQTTLTAYEYEKVLSKRYQYVDIDTDVYGQLCLSSNKPVFVVSFVKGFSHTENSDVFMTIIPSTSMFASYVFLDFDTEAELGMNQDMFSVLIVHKKALPKVKVKTDTIAYIRRCQFVALTRKASIWPILEFYPNMGRYIYGSYNVTRRSGIGMPVNMQFVGPPPPTTTTTTPASPLTTSSFAPSSSSISPTKTLSTYPTPLTPTETSNIPAATVAVTTSSLSTSSYYDEEGSSRTLLCGCYRNTSPGTNASRTKTSTEDFLRLDRKVLSRHRRRLGCAHDHRPSAVGVGYAGVATLVMTVAVFAVSDLFRYVKFVSLRNLTPTSNTTDK